MVVNTDRQNPRRAGRGRTRRRRSARRQRYPAPTRPSSISRRVAKVDPGAATGIRLREAGKQRRKAPADRRKGTRRYAHDDWYRTCSVEPAVRCPSTSEPIVGEAGCLHAAKRRQRAGRYRRRFSGQPWIELGNGLKLPDDRRGDEQRRRTAPTQRIVMLPPRAQKQRRGSRPRTPANATFRRRERRPVRSSGPSPLMGEGLGQDSRCRPVRSSGGSHQQEGSDTPASPV